MFFAPHVSVFGFAHGSALQRAEPSRFIRFSARARVHRTAVVTDYRTSAGLSHARKNSQLKSHPCAFTGNLRYMPRSPRNALSLPKAGALSAAACYNGGVVVASVCKPESPLVMELGTRKIAHVTDGCCVLYSGLAADSRVLTRKAADTALEYRRKFGDNTSVPVGTLVSKIAEVLQDYTQIGGVRPFGVALLVAGIDCIYKVEPSGSFSAWKCIAVGKGSLAAEAMLHEGFKESMDRDSALELLLSVLQKCSIDTSRQNIDTAFIEDSSK